MDNEKLTDKFSFKIQLDNIYTKADLLVYYATKDEIVAANSEINVEKCLPNNVSITCLIFSNFTV